jgi:hypothetical protein
MNGKHETTIKLKRNNVVQGIYIFTSFPVVFIMQQFRIGFLKMTQQTKQCGRINVAICCELEPYESCEFLSISYIWQCCFLSVGLLPVTKAMGSATVLFVWTELYSKVSSCFR